MTITGALPAGSSFQIAVIGAGAGYDGTYQATSTGTTTCTFPLNANPGAAATGGTLVVYAAAPLAQIGANASASGLDLAFESGLVVIPAAYSKASVAVTPSVTA